MSAVHDPAPERDHPIGGTPYELPGASDAAATTKLREAINLAFPGRGKFEGAPWWSEAPILSNAMGIPTVYFAPGNVVNCHTLEERISLEEYLAAIEAYAVFIADFCGVEAEAREQTLHVAAGKVIQ